MSTSLLAGQTEDQAARAAAIGLTSTLASTMAMTRPKTCLPGSCRRCVVDGIWVSLSPVTCNLPVLTIDTAYFHRDEAEKVDNAEGIPSTHTRCFPAACTRRDCLRKVGLPEGELVKLMTADRLMMPAHLAKPSPLSDRAYRALL